MNFNNKFGSISEALSLRIKRGDYKLMPLPTEEALAREFSVSRMTARRAILELLDKKMLFR